MLVAADIPKTNLIVLDDHVLVAEGFKELLLKIMPQGSGVSIFSSVDKARTALQNADYGIIITDLIIPGQSVLDFISYSRKTYKEIVILVLSSVIDTTSIKSCLAAGANGYLSKASNIEEIRLALEYTHKGRKFVSSDLSGRLAESLLFNESSILTNKELEIIRLIADGHRTKSIAELLFVSPVTIMTHKRNIMRKLDLHSVTELVKYVYENNLT